MRRIFLLLLCATALAPNRAPGAVLRLAGDRLTVHAADVPLRDLLAEFQHAGVRVWADPRIDRTITAHMRDRPIEKALRSLLSPLDYIIEWDVVRTPLGPLYRLAELRVFPAGEAQRVQPLSLSAGTTNGAPSIRNQTAFVPREILLALKPGTDLRSFKSLLTEIGGTVIECLPELGVYRVRLPLDADVPAQVKALTSNPSVALAEPNYLFRLPSPTATGDAASIPTLRPSKAPPTGAPLVAILDTGLDPNAAPAGVIVASLDAINPQSPVSDTLGHGTQMALIASGAVQPQGQADGSLAATVGVIPIRAFDQSGAADAFTLLRAVQFAMDKGARVMSMSWSSPSRSGFLEQIIAAAIANGTIAVAAAGNEPTGAPVYPAAFPGVIAVSAMLPTGQIWDRSNTGSFVTLAAPGVAQLPVGYNGPAGTYAGTSIATAFAARIIADYLRRHPAASMQQVTEALKASLTDRGAAGPDPQYGLGALDAAAVSALLQ